MGHNPIKRGIQICAIIPLSMAGQKERYTRPERVTYSLEVYRKNEREIKALGDELLQIAIDNRSASDEQKERARRLAAVREALLSEAYTQAIADNKAFDRRARIPGYRHRYKLHTVARAAGQITKEIITGYLEGVASPHRSPLSQDIRYGAKKAGEWYRNKRRSGR